MDYSYRFKTKEEFEKEFGPNWRGKIPGNTFPSNMDYLLGQPFPYDYNELLHNSNGVEYNFPSSNYPENTWFIVKDMLIKNEPKLPNYKPRKKRILESVYNYWNDYDTIIIVIPDYESCDIFFDFIKEELPEYYNKMGKDVKTNMQDYLDEGRKPYSRYDKESDRFKQATTELIPNLDQKYERLFYVEDLPKIKHIILGTTVPNYKPRKRVLENLNEGILNKKYEYATIVIAINNLKELETAKKYLEEYEIDAVINPIKRHLNQNEPCYVRIKKDMFFNYIVTYSLLDRLSSNSMDNDYTYEKVFSVDDLKRGLLDNIKLYGNSMIKPDYSPRKRVLESVNEDIEIIVIRIENNEELKLLKTIGHIYDYSSIAFPNWFFIHIKDKNAMICPWDDTHSDYDGAMDYINNNDNIYKKIYTIKDLNLIEIIIKLGKLSVPSYAPRKKRVLEKLNESTFHPIYNYNSILITIKNSSELKRALYHFADEPDDVLESIEYGIKDRLDDGDECYIRIREDGKLKFSSLYMLRDNIQNSNITYEKLFTMDDVENGVLKNIYKYGKSNPKPNYTSKKRNINEGVLNPNYNYGHIIILINNKEELEESKKYLSGFGDWNIVYRNILNDIDIKPYYIRIYNNNYIDNGIYLGRGSQEFLYSDSFKRTYDYEKFYTVDDLKNGLINSIQLRGEYITKPNYKPKKYRTMENFTTEQLLLEKSSLTNLGVPREVMQPIQRDFAIPADATWDRITLKRDVDTLFRKGDKELLLQISIDYIKVFVSQYGKYFVDTYVMKDSGWGGEYEKLERENVSLTQLLYQIEPKTLLYNLKSDFSTQKQYKRKLIKKEKEFELFTNKFKEDFLKNFNSILKRIVGSKYKDAKKEIQDKAKQIELENQMMISGLDDPLAGPNSMTILDNFISEFEEAYSDFFGEYLDIQELSQHFTREKIMTAFMLFIYSGRVMK